MADLYFGYGSNLNHKDWTTWCRRRGVDSTEIKPITTVTLRDHALIFHYYSKSRGGGALDIVKRSGHNIRGVLFSVTPLGWRLLDDKEGHPERYRRVVISVDDANDNRYLATTYQVTHQHNQRRFIRPSPEYVQIVRVGLSEHGLDDRHLDEAARGDILD